jgi:hypothetical protein
MAFLKVTFSKVVVLMRERKLEWRRERREAQNHHKKLFAFFSDVENRERTRECGHHTDIAVVLDKTISQKDMTPAAVGFWKTGFRKR